MSPPKKRGETEKTMTNKLALSFRPSIFDGKTISERLYKISVGDDFSQKTEKTLGQGRVTRTSQNRI